MKTKLKEIKSRVESARAAMYELAIEGTLDLGIGAGNHLQYEIEESFAQIGEIMEELDQEDKLREEWLSEMEESEIEDHEILTDKWHFGL